MFNMQFIYYYIALFFITLLIHFILFILSRYDKQKKQNEYMIDNAALILEKLDNLKQTGGKTKMNKDIQILAKYLDKKILEAKEEIIEQIQDLEIRLDELDGVKENDTEDYPEDEELDTEFEDFSDNIDSEFSTLLESEKDEETDIEVPKPSPPPKPPKSLDISKRQKVTATEEAPVRKRGGLFRSKGK